jgi:hypothetical protein
MQPPMQMRGEKSEQKLSTNMSETLKSKEHNIPGMYVCMYKGRALKCSPCTATFNNLLCFPF